MKQTYYKVDWTGECPNGLLVNITEEYNKKPRHGHVLIPNELLERITEAQKVAGHMGHALWHVHHPGSTFPCSQCRNTAYKMDESNYSIQCVTCTYNKQTVITRNSTGEHVERFCNPPGKQCPILYDNKTWKAIPSHGCWLAVKDGVLFSAPMGEDGSMIKEEAGEVDASMIEPGTYVELLMAWRG